jgi:hypothetical protein
MAFAFGLLQDRHAMTECKVLDNAEAMLDRKMALRALLEI